MNIVVGFFPGERNNIILQLSYWAGFPVVCKTFAGAQRYQGLGDVRAPPRC